jgi:hypothetical protein
VKAEAVVKVEAGEVEVKVEEAAAKGAVDDGQIFPFESGSG